MQPKQVAILTALKQSDLAKTELRAASGIYGAAFVGAYATLKNAGMVDECSMTPKRRTLTVSITTHGRLALTAHMRDSVSKVGHLTQPNAISKLCGTYVPPVWAARNSGNAHIQSRGFQ